MYLHKITKFIKKISDKISDFIFPPVCLNCQKKVLQPHFICAQCWKEFYFITPPFCKIYGTPLQMGDSLTAISDRAFYDPPPFHRARAVVLHQGLGKEFIARHKYHDNLHLTPFLGQLMQKAGYELLADCEVIIPVPLHYWRFFSRRYNQAQELARFIARHNHKIYLPNAVFRKKYTKQQASLNALARENNVKNAFAVNKKYEKQLCQKKILIIDDVYTTGATVKALCQTLSKVSPKQIDILTFSCAYKAK